MELEIEGRYYFFPGTESNRRTSRGLSGLVNSEEGDNFMTGTMNDFTSDEDIGTEIEGSAVWCDAYFHLAFLIYGQGTDESNKVIMVKGFRTHQRLLRGVSQDLPTGYPRGFLRDSKNVYRMRYLLDGLEPNNENRVELKLTKK